MARTEFQLVTKNNNYKMNTASFARVHWDQYVRSHRQSLWTVAEKLGTIPTAQSYKRTQNKVMPVVKVPVELFRQPRSTRRRDQVYPCFNKSRWRCNIIITSRLTRVRSPEMSLILSAHRFLWKMWQTDPISNINQSPLALATNKMFDKTDNIF